MGRVIAILLSIVALALTPVLAVVNVRRLGRATIPLTLMAVMAALSSMYEVFEWWVPGLITGVHTWRGQYVAWYVPTHERPWSLLADCLPGVLAVAAIIWLILVSRRVPPC